jgi:hypothetical protein
MDFLESITDFMKFGGQHFIQNCSDRAIPQDSEIIKAIFRDPVNSDIVEFPIWVLKHPGCTTLHGFIRSKQTKHEAPLKVYIILRKNKKPLHAYFLYNQKTHELEFHIQFESKEFLRQEWRAYSNEGYSCYSMNPNLGNSRKS